MIPKMNESPKLYFAMRIIDETNTVIIMTKIKQKYRNMIFNF